MTKKVGIVIPLRLTPERERPFEFVHNWLKTEFVDIPIYISDSVGEQFNVSEARNRGCLQAINDGVDILMVIDADSFVIDKTKIIEAFDLATSGVLILTKAYINLSERESKEKHTEGDIKNKQFDFGPTFDTPGGVWVLSVEVFQKINGWDERFIGWGFEDNALNKAYKEICEKRIYRVDTAVLSFSNKTRNYTIPSLYNNKQRNSQYEAISSKEEMLEMVSKNMVHLGEERFTLD